jgi:hypothetical protein
MDGKRKTRRTTVKTRLTPKKSSSARKATSAPKRRNADAAPDEIVFVESSNVGGSDSKPLRKAAVISGATQRIIGMQG